MEKEKLVYYSSECKNNFTKFKTIRTFGRDIYDGKIPLKEADEDQSNLIHEIDIFNKKTRQKDVNKKNKKTKSS